MSSDRYYKRQVALAKALIQEYLENKWKICKIAMDVCEIRVGRHLAKTKKPSLSQFANDIGMNRKTLIHWTIEYRKVYLKLNEKQKKALKAEDIRIISRIVKSDATQREIDKQVKRRDLNRSESLFERRLKNLVLLANYFDTLNYDMLEKEQVEGIKRLARRILK